MQFLMHPAITVFIFAVWECMGSHIKGYSKYDKVRLQVYIVLYLLQTPNYTLFNIHFDGFRRSKVPGGSRFGSGSNPVHALGSVRIPNTLYLYVKTLNWRRLTNRNTSKELPLKDIFLLSMAFDEFGPIACSCFAIHTLTDLEAQLDLVRTAFRDNPFETILKLLCTGETTSASLGFILVRPMNDTRPHSTSGLCSDAVKHIYCIISIYSAVTVTAGPAETN